MENKILDMVIYSILVLSALYLGILACLPIELPIIVRILYIIAGLSALMMIFRRDFYLPFLGSTVYPCGSLATKVPANATLKVKIQTVPNSNVIYWASEPNKEIKEALKAYDAFDNCGVALSDKNGFATLSVRPPSSYMIPGGKVLTPHIHYRICMKKGMLGPVKTVQIMS